MARLSEKYKNEIIPAMFKEFKYKNIMQVPKLEKIVINISNSQVLQNPKIIENMQKELATISGQKPVVTKAKKSIATFKLREGQNLGVCVTLRKQRMYEFLDRLFNIALPRVRDFRGLSPKAFDGKGNYTLGLKEQLLFPEISYDKVDAVRGMNITIVTTAETDKEAKTLLEHFGLPYRK